MPTLAGFQDFVTGVMQISTSVLDPASPSIIFAYDYALYVVSDVLQGVAPGAPLAAPQSLYDIAVYNLAGHNLILFGVDSPTSSNPTYFQNARNSFKLNGFTAGVVTQASDEGTAASFTEAEWAKSLTIDQLQMLKTPWGQAYLALAQSSSTLWGLS